MCKRPATSGSFGGCSTYRGRVSLAQLLTGHHGLAVHRLQVYVSPLAIQLLGWHVLLLPSSIPVVWELGRSGKTHGFRRGMQALDPGFTTLGTLLTVLEASLPHL